MNYRLAREAVEACESGGLRVAVNQNMRYDQSIRALKTLLDRGDLGTPVFATIEMRAIPHWMPWARQYDRLTLLIMSIHHLDVFRYLFGDPESVYASARTDPRARFPHRDGIVLYILEYADGLRAAAWDDVWAGPAREGAASDIYIKWRVEGTDGLAQGTIGWPGYPNAVPSTIRFATKRQPGCWIEPRWSETWFPDAFEGTMGELLWSIAEDRRPVIGARDNLRTMMLLEACYHSLQDHRPVRLDEIQEDSHEARAD
jgi:predicted dehydrogenase